MKKKRFFSPVVMTCLLSISMVLGCQMVGQHAIDSQRGEKPMPTMPEPIVGLGESVTSRYVGGRSDSTRSQVDEEKSAAYEAAVKPLRTARSAFANQANRYTEKGRIKDALTTGKWLETWAKADALTAFYNEGTSEQDRRNHSIQQLNLSQSLSGVATSYMQVKEVLPKDQRSLIETWLKKVDNTLKESSTPDMKALAHNHAYWRAAAHGAVGAATNDNARLERGMVMARIGVRQLANDPEGLFPAEMMRGAKSTSYQHYAATPLTLVAELGIAHGKGNLYEEQGGALKRLFQETLVPSLAGDEVVNSRLASRAGTEQDKVKSSDLGGVAMFHRRYPETSTENAVNRFLFQQEQGEKTIKDIKIPQLGGKISLIYPLSEKKSLSLLQDKEQAEIFLYRAPSNNLAFSVAQKTAMCVG
jgi:Alginate lyase